MFVDIRSREFTDSTLERDFEYLQRNIYPKASRIALNTTARKIKTRAGRIAAAALRIRVGVARARIKIVKATRNRPFEATIIGLLLPILAHDLGKVRRARGVAKAGRHTFPRPAFVTTTRSGFTSVFKRDPLPSQRQSPDRKGRSANLPIKEQSIPAGRELDSAIEREVQNSGPVIWKAEMERQLKRELDRGTS